MAAVVTGGSAAELQGLVRAYVRDLKLAGVPPEHALAEVKASLGLSKITPLQRTGLTADRIAAQVVEWFVAEYYRAD